MFTLWHFLYLRPFCLVYSFVLLLLVSPAKMWTPRDESHVSLVQHCVHRDRCRGWHIEGAQYVFVERITTLRGDLKAWAKESALKDSNTELENGLKKEVIRNQGGESGFQKDVPRWGAVTGEQVCLTGKPTAYRCLVSCQGPSLPLGAAICLSVQHGSWEEVPRGSGQIWKEISQRGHQRPYNEMFCLVTS